MRIIMVILAVLLATPAAAQHTRSQWHLVLHHQERLAAEWARHCRALRHVAQYHPWGCRP